MAPTLSAVISSPDAGDRLVQHWQRTGRGDLYGRGRHLRRDESVAVHLGDGADQSLAAITVTDVAGNVSARQGPTAALTRVRWRHALAVISSPDAVTGWYNIGSGPAVVTYTAADATSGVTNPSPYTFGDGANQSLAAITVTDVAGNVSSGRAYSGINQDTVAPRITVPANIVTTYGAPAVTYSDPSATDAGSGLASLVFTPPSPIATSAVGVTTVTEPRRTLRAMPRPARSR